LWILGLLLVIPLQDTRPATAQTLYDQARLEFLRGDVRESQLEAERGDRRFSFSDPDWAAKFRLLEAETMVSRGMYDDSLRLLRGYTSSSNGAEGLVKRLAIEAVAYTRQQQFAVADQALTQAESICERETYAVCGEVLRDRGISAVAKGDYATARQFFLQTRDFAHAHGDRFLEASATLNLGWTALQVDRFDEAMDWSRSAHRASVALGAEGMAEKSSGNLGWAYFNLGEDERALELFLEAERSAAALGNIRSELGWITTAGNVYRNTNDLNGAFASYNRALSLAKQINSKEDIVNSLEDLAHASIDAGRIDEASAYVQQLDPLVGGNGNRLDALDVMLAEGRIAEARREDQRAEVLFHTVENDPASQTSMRMGSEHELARLYEMQGNVTQADDEYRTSLTTFESARSQLKNEASKLPFLANATSIYDDYIQFLVKRGKTDEALALADQSRARTLAQGLGIDTDKRSFKPAVLHPSEVARKAGATLLFYWLGAKQSYLWAVTQRSTILYPLPAQSEIIAAVERYRRTLLGPGGDAESANEDGIALYQMLVAPAQKLLPPNATVVILNDGVLSQLNFETLMVPAPHSHYWIEDASVICAPSIRMLASAKPAQAAGNRLLLIGDAVSPNPDYPELPMAAFEMEKIRKHFDRGDQTIFARKQANSEAYLDSNPERYSNIHFVAHGVASSADPLDSAIILSRTTNADDSFKLYAREIIQHPIHARLVTISACYGSGTRSYAGEGLVGLSWAFLRAGAHNVIGALWEVSDDSTPRLMDVLYGGLEQGMTPSVALRNAKLALLHSQGNFRRPFYWAPFQVYTGL
jgi:CHAT domain-containing protein